jgi:hypothetical protein
LHKIVAVGVFNQVSEVMNYHICQGHLLIGVALFKTPLKHAAPMFVHSDFLTVAHASVKYELGKDSILLSSGSI